QKTSILSSLPVTTCHPGWSRARGARALPNGRALGHRHPISRSRPRQPAGPALSQGSAAPGTAKGWLLQAAQDTTTFTLTALRRTDLARRVANAPVPARRRRARVSSGGIRSPGIPNGSPAPARAPRSATRTPRPMRKSAVATCRKASPRSTSTARSPGGRPVVLAMCPLGGDDVGSVPVEAGAGPVVAHGGARVGMGRSLLHVVERNPDARRDMRQKGG